jgi:hypothetical protein
MAAVKNPYCNFKKTMNVYQRNDKLAAWLRGAGKSTSEASKMLAELAFTTEAMIRQWVSGRRKMSADSAGRVESAMNKFSAINIHAPQPLTRGDLCEACSECPYHKHVIDL